MTRFAYRHGPSQGRHVQTTHRYDAPAIPRVALAGKYGWCVYCENQDTPGVKFVWHQDGRARYKVAVCDRHARGREDAR